LRHSHDARVTLTGSCAELQALVPREAVVGMPETTTGYGYGTTCGGVLPGVDFQVEPEVPVFWRDGRPAGRTLRPSSLHAYARKDVGELACFEQSPNRFGCGSERVELCFRHNDLAVIPVRRPPETPAE